VGEEETEGRKNKNGNVRAWKRDKSPEEKEAVRA
jgi:hypothetical protein